MKDGHAQNGKERAKVSDNAFSRLSASVCNAVHCTAVGRRERGTEKRLSFASLLAPAFNNLFCWLTFNLSHMSTVL